MSRIRIGIVGMGKIARDQHLPAIAASDAFELAAVASPHHRLEGVRHYADVAALLDAEPDIAALAVCTPPQIRYAIARQAIERGRHVLLEKPPAATLSEAAALAELAARHHVGLMATWHAREAAAVTPARDWLAGCTVRRVLVTWKEDVRVWHPGQEWIWRCGGLGVFDPGINALSILTHLLAQPLLLEEAHLFIPVDCDTPIAAALRLTDTQGAAIRCEFDFRQTGPPTWDIDIETDRGRLVLSKGGAVLHANDRTIVQGDDREYACLYARFAQVVHERRVDVDLAPLRLVADAFLRGRRTAVAAFAAAGEG